MISAVMGSWRLLSRRRKTALTFLGLGNLLLNTLDIVAISLVGVIGAIALGGTNRLTDLGLSDVGTDEAIPYLLALAAILFAVKTVVGVLLARAQFTFLARIETAFSERIAHHVLGGDLSAVKSYSRSDLEWSILRSTDIAFSRLLGRALVLLAELGLAVLILGLFIYTDWASALIIFFYFSLVLAFLQLFAHRKSRISGSQVAEGSVSVGQAVADSIAAFKEISVLARLDYFVERIREARGRVALGNATQFYLQAIPRLFMELALILGAIGFVVFLSVRNEGTPDFGLLSIFVVGSLRMMSALLPLQRAFMELRFYAPQALGAQIIIRDALSSKMEKPKQENRLVANSASEEVSTQRAFAVEVSAVSFSYSDRGVSDPVLRDISLTIEPGQMVAFIGPSGAGKSTLIDLILGLHEPSSGQILCDGAPPKQYRSAKPGVIGYVPQKPGLVSGSVRENVALGLRREEVDEEALAEALDQAEIADFVDSLPQGVDSSFGHHVDSLSGGQIQRIGLARALYTKPRLLVLDEATSALDAEIEASISSSLKNLRQKSTIVIVAHRLSTIQDADVVVAMEGGTVVGSGSFKDLQASSPLVRRYVSLMTIR